MNNITPGTLYPDQLFCLEQYPSAKGIDINDPYPFYERKIFRVMRVVPSRNPDHTGVMIKSVACRMTSLEAHESVSEHNLKYFDRNPGRILSPAVAANNWRRNRNEQEEEH
jgi:hypothetical protein